MPEELQDNPKSLNKKRIVFFIFVFIFVTSIIAIALFKYDVGKIPPKTIKINNAEFEVEIADTEAEREQGLMNTESLPTNEGMIFMYSEEGYRTFWMKNTLISLDMIFIDDSYHIVKIFDNVPPCTSETCDTYRCEKRAKYVLEINGGLSQEYGFKMGDKVDFEL